MGANWKCGKSFAFLAACVVLAGCGGPEGASPALAPAKAASQLEKAFSTADRGVKTNVEAATAAMKENKFQDAFLALEMAKSQPGVTVEQALALRDSMETVQRQLAEAVVRGDSNAIRAIQMIRGRPGP